ncbi:hypothetical protein MVEN_01137200 [Mycena venus]|uniref:Uncharacterized protein n=1 Tax=Mycena venus TaxID=2733690 RepID=A0A8H6Y5C5_9AGAR|nr:hypothetical protein MVEN_01137200 [Mycena venus]
MLLLSDVALHFSTDMFTSFTDLFSDPSGVPTVRLFASLSASPLQPSGAIASAASIHSICFTVSTMFPLTSLMSHHNLPLRWRRVNPHVKFLFDFSCFRGQLNVVVINFDVTAANLQIQFFRALVARPPCPPPMLLIGLVVSFAGGCAMISSSSMLHFFTLLTRPSEPDVSASPLNSLPVSHRHRQTHLMSSTFLCFTFREPH